MDYHPWHYDGKGKFSVISAYQVYVQGRDEVLVQSSVGLAQEDVDWKKLWKVPCKPKVQQFLWQLAHNSLRVKIKHPTERNRM